MHRGLSELLCEQGDLETAAQHLLTARKLGGQAAPTGWPPRYAGAFYFPPGIPISKSPHQSPHVVMTPHYIVRYPLIEDKERAQRRRSPPVSQVQGAQHE
jgi:hypothetical protein